MMARLIATASVALLASYTPTLAQETGLSDLHSKVRVGGKLCMADHFHYGQSGGAPSRKAAEVAAIRDWADFTSLEYGSAWGNFQLAAAKGIKCSKSGNNAWGCNVEARPCRR